MPLGTTDTPEEAEFWRQVSARAIPDDDLGPPLTVEQWQCLVTNASRALMSVRSSDMSKSGVRIACAVTIEATCRTLMSALEREAR